MRAKLLPYLKLAALVAYLFCGLSFVVAFFAVATYATPPLWASIGFLLIFPVGWLHLRLNPDL